MASQHDVNIVTFVHIMQRWISWGLIGAVSLSGCQAPQVVLPDALREVSQDQWQTYRNPRFSYEFQYPGDWVDSLMPENRDGVAFRDPRNPEVEIRGWAEFKLREKSTASKQPMNFTTLQGIPGRLDVRIEPQQSFFSLTIYQGNVEYNWRGTAPSRQFDAYYRFFSYVANRYRVPAKS